MEPFFIYLHCIYLHIQYCSIHVMFNETLFIHVNVDFEQMQKGSEGPLLLASISTD